MKLFEPITVRNVTFKNRIVMAPMATGYRHRNPKAREYYVERARGGTGTIILAAVAVDMLLRDEFADGLRTWITEPVHENGEGVKIGTQLWHGNLYRPKGEVVQPMWVAPSPGLPDGIRPLVPVLQQPMESLCRELTIDEIQDIVAKYATSAAKTKRAGFDFVEVHACHGNNLPSQFLSPRENHRTDIYGGDLKGRMRFSIEVAKAIRAALGSECPFFWRLTAGDGLPGGAMFADSIELAAELERVGVDVIDVSYGHEISHEVYPFVRAEAMADQPFGTFIGLAEVIKRKVLIPVIGVGRVNRPEIAEKALLRGQVDMVAIGRQLIADPYWPKKVMEGRVDEIIPCISCNTCLGDFKPGPMRCAVNATVGREAEFRVRPAEERRKVLIVGGGPAGMEAARIAALRGHQVTLYEERDQLGGQLLVAKVPPHKEILGDFVRYLTRQLEKSGVEVKLMHRVSPDSLDEIKPDVVILSTGATQSLPDIPGVRQSNVMTALDVLSRVREVGKSAAILGGARVGCETAEYLAEKGVEVTILRRGPQILDVSADEVSVMEREAILYRLGKNGVRVFTSVKYEAITEKGIVFYDKVGKKQILMVDTIVLAIGFDANDELAKAWGGRVQHLFQAGDCVEPRRIIDAIHEAAQVAHLI